jgi:hypothetical protein
MSAVSVLPSPQPSPSTSKPTPLLSRMMRSASLSSGIFDRNAVMYCSLLLSAYQSAALCGSRYKSVCSIWPPGPLRTASIPRTICIGSYCWVNQVSSAAPWLASSSVSRRDLTLARSLSVCGLARSKSLFDVVNGRANHPGLSCQIRHTQPGFLASAAQKFPKVRRGRSDDLSLFEQGLFRNRLHKSPLCSLHRIGRKRRTFLTDCAGLDGQPKPQRIGNGSLGIPLLHRCPWMTLLFLCSRGSLCTG